MRNVVLFCLDSVRADTFDAAAPRLTEAADCTYSGCRAASTWSAPSYASMLTGELPHRHGVHTHDRSLEGIDPRQTLIGDLESHTALGVSTNVFAGSPFGFDRFFDRFADISPTRRFPRGLDPAAAGGGRLPAPLEYAVATLRSDHRLESLGNGLLGAVDAVTERAPVSKITDDGASAVVRESKRQVRAAEEPFVLVCTFMEAHTPLRQFRGFDESVADVSSRFSTDQYGIWELLGEMSVDPAERESFVQTRRRLYAAAVDYLDRTIAPFCDWLERETERETTIVITADHGENLGYDHENGYLRHKSSCSEGLLHVPLVVINPPPGYPAQEPELVSHLDLRELLVALAREDVLDISRSRVVAEHVGMSAGPEPPARRAYWDRLMRAAYDQSGTRKTVWDSLGNCTDYRLDPTRPCWQAALDESVEPPAWVHEHVECDADTAKRTALAGEDPSPSLEAAVQDRLARLGYV